MHYELWTMNYALSPRQPTLHSPLSTMHYHRGVPREKKYVIIRNPVILSFCRKKICLSVSLSKKLHIYAKTPPKNAQNSVEIFHRFREKKWWILGKNRVDFEKAYVFLQQSIPLWVKKHTFFTQKCTLFWAKTDKKLHVIIAFGRFLQVKNCTLSLKKSPTP